VRHSTSQSASRATRKSLARKSALLVWLLPPVLCGLLIASHWLKPVVQVSAASASEASSKMPAKFAPAKLVPTKTDGKAIPIKTVKKAPSKPMMPTWLIGMYIFILAIFVGFEVITKVPQTLHTPLMSGANAISGITVVGAIFCVRTDHVTVANILGFIALACAMMNVVGGFIVTDIMLQKFKKRS